ncbi:bcl-2-like protein 11 [Brachionichthys hirsutus]|uniref:bcl-2-like protein 11 n=1 Tax=Brachionichthys hirsutus TaxID=412623 RepID=UPI0036050549
MMEPKLTVPLCSFNRPLNRSDGSTAVTAAQESGGDPTPAGASGAQTSRSDRHGSERSAGNPSSSSSSSGGGEPDPPPRDRPNRIPPPPIFHIRRRASSGYFSSDSGSVPSTPLSPKPAKADGAAQTPSPTCQVIRHALQCMAEAHGGEPGGRRLHGHAPSMWPQNAARDMQTEAIGRELRRIGDDFNRQLLLRGMAGRHRRVVIRPNLLPQIHQEPTMLLCMSLLLLLIGRMIYLQGSMDSQDHAQV